MLYLVGLGIALLALAALPLRQTASGRIKEALALHRGVVAALGVEILVVAVVVYPWGYRLRFS